MARNHGWQLPAHSFQVVAISVFFLLVVVFYPFFAPFLGSHILEYASITAYSVVALLVLILYVRCTAIDPADPGIFPNISGKSNTNLNMPENVVEDEDKTHSSPSSACRSSLAANSSRKDSVLEVARMDILPGPASYRVSSGCNFLGILCAPFVYEDCCKQGGAMEQQAEEALFCTLCNAEVRKFSKHCRSCDKCVDGFDHHCRWLNNCVGRKNYVSFIALMAASLIWLAIEAGVGIAVLVRFFVDKKEMENQIVERLGNVFSGAPFATVVAISSVLSLLACVPLGELFFFHMILIRKGITTYEYVVAMRAMSEAPAGASVDEEMPNIVYSPSGSATTGVSGGSSLGLQYKGAWCTPPRVFVDYQDEVIPHLEPGMIPSTVDPDAAGYVERGNKQPKRPVRISAWKLAKLDSNEAMRAAAKARASSSVLRPVDNRSLHDPDLSSSEGASIRSSASIDVIGYKGAKNDLGASPFKSSCTQSHCSQDDYETRTQSMSSLSSPSHVHESVTLGPLPFEHTSGPSNPTTSAIPHFIPDRHSLSKAAFPSNPIFRSATSEFDEKILRKGNKVDPILSALPAPILRDGKRTSVVWDQEAGRYVSIPISTRTIANAAESRIRSLQIGVINSTSETSNSNRRATAPPPPQPSLKKTPSEETEKLTYTGESIFFGGPLLSVPARDDSRFNGTNGLRQNNERREVNLPLGARIGKGTSSNQFPLFNPGGFERDPPTGPT